MDLQSGINLRTEVVIIDELAHTNFEGSKNKKSGRISLTSKMPVST